MSSVPVPRAASLRWPTRVTPALLLCVGFAAMALPALLHLARAYWSIDEQGHGPVILAASLWLMWKRRDRLALLDPRPADLAGIALLALALPAFVIGRSQEIVQLEVGAPILAAAAVLLLLRGWRALRLMAPPMLFLLFIVPYPGVFVQALTVPLKTGVSAAAEALLHLFDYPIARTGVVLAIDQYHLLVADACAGLTSMFTLEALGLVYISLRGHASRLRNVVLALLVVPISFVANVVRVIVLVLVTYHLGESAGQGFLHGFAGLLLFVAAALMLFGVDALLARLPERTTP
jgi:exosortase B